MENHSMLDDITLDKDELKEFDESISPDDEDYFFDDDDDDEVVPAKTAPVEETPVVDVPVTESPVEETSVEETPVEVAPVEEAPAEEIFPVIIPVQEALMEDVVATPASEDAVSETSTPNEAPVEPTPNAVTPEPTPVVADSTPTQEEQPAKKEKKEKVKKEKVKKEKKPLTKKQKKNRLILRGIIAFLLVVAIGVYAKIAYDYKSIFLKNTTVNGLDASQKTVEEVKDELTAFAQAYELNIQFRDGITETITAQDIDYAYVPDNSVQEALDAQNIIFWPAGYLKETPLDVKAPTTFDANKLNSIITSYSTMQAENMVAPTDAHVAFENGAFFVADETYGNTLDTNVVINAINDAVANGTTELNMDDVDGAYAQPTLYVDDPKLAHDAENLNQLCTASITYTLPSGEFVLDGNTLKDWLAIDADGNYYKDEALWNQNISDFVDRLSNDVEQHTFNATGIGPINIGFTVAGFTSDCGWWIDRDTERAQLTEELNSNTITTREPVWGLAPFTMENNGYGYDQIEIDLSRQHLWVYKEGQCIFDTDCVSGAMIPSKYTPPGIYKVGGKERYRTLRGRQIEPGVYEYETQVAYWVPFIMDIGIGLHDATWQWAFGGTRYMQGYGSHGCINLSYSDAGFIYDIAYSGLPVIVYYSEGCPLE